MLKIICLMAGGIFMWRRRFVGFWTSVMLVITVLASATIIAGATVSDAIEKQLVIAEVAETEINPSTNTETVECYAESETNMDNILESGTVEVAENVSKATLPVTLLNVNSDEAVSEDESTVEEKCLADLLSEAQTSATKAIAEDDPQAITFVEELENGTRIYEFKNQPYTIPANLLKREPLVSESGYVEKITHVPHYLQQSYPKTNYGRHGTVSSHGCGIASCAMVYSYLLDCEIRPDELAEQYGRYNTEHGSDYELFSQSAEDYGLEVTKSHCWSEVEEALREGCIVIALVKSNTIFTDGGHYIVYYGITEDDKLLVHDPNIYNFGKWSSNALKTGFSEGFDLKYCRYSVPCWIYQPKDIEAVAERAANY